VQAASAVSSPHRAPFVGARSDEPSAQGAVVTEKIHDTLGTIESTLDDMITTMSDLKKKLK